MFCPLLKYHGKQVPEGPTSSTLKIVGSSLAMEFIFDVQNAVLLIIKINLVLEQK